MEARGFALTPHATRSGNFHLEGRTAVITGAGRGIGRAIARRFAASGARVLLLDIDCPQAEAVAREIAEAGGLASAWECDVSCQEHVKAIFARIFREGRVHILVNTAGIAHVGKLEGTTEADFDRVFGVNVKGFYNCMLAAVEHMKSHGGGVILNLASIAAWAGLATALLIR